MNQKKLHAGLRAGRTITSVPVQQLTDGNPHNKKSNRDINEINLEVLAAEKDKLRLECEYIKLKMKQVSADLDFVEMQKNS